jgi:hypothetical protein
MANNLERVGPFVLESDDDGHHYVIPVSKQDDWNDWVGSHAAQDGIVPDYAEAVGGSPTRVHFTGYTIK